MSSSVEMSTSNFADACQNLQIGAENLIPVIPYGGRLANSTSVSEKDIGKAQGSYNPRNGGVWWGLSRNNKSLVSEIEREKWAKYPTPNVGVLGHGFPAFDSDAESRDAYNLIKRTIETVFAGSDYAIRYRGRADRRLYAFKAWDIVQTRRVEYTLNGVKSKIELLGSGNYYVASGTHPSGDEYRWDGGAKLHKGLSELSQADADEFFRVLFKNLDALGATYRETQSGTGADGKDFSKCEPTVTLGNVMACLHKWPNNAKNCPDRNDIVGLLAGAKAALGREADAAIDDLREWACEDPSWCDEEYFDKIWESVQDTYATQESFGTSMRKRGIMDASKDAFPNGNTPEITDVIATAMDTITAGKPGEFDRVADVFVFRDENNLEGLSQPMVRSRFLPDRNEVKSLGWWQRKTPLSDVRLLADVQRHSDYTLDAEGLANFLRDLRAHRPDCFFDDTTFDPTSEFGDVVYRERDGTRLLNLRSQSQAVLQGRVASQTKGQDAEDLRVISELMNGIFGAHVDYELDTLAYMLQTNRRPGSLLFLVGDPGVGKSIYVEMLVLLFDGKHSIGKGYVSGADLANESKRAFAFAKIEGCRIVQIREMPNHMSDKTRGEVTSTLKEMCDFGPAGEVIQVNAKYKQAKIIENVCRVIVTSNHLDSLEIEPDERRIFMIESGLNISNKKSKKFYGEVVNIMYDPKRLAAFYRLLMDRDISRYRPQDEPPVTKTKTERNILGQRAVRRHFLAAIELLNHSGRELTTAKEVRKIMTELAIIEEKNTDGAISDISDYAKLDHKSATGREIALAFRVGASNDKFVRIDRDVRDDDHQRYNVYALIDGIRRGLHKSLKEETSAEILYMLEQDMSYGLRQHPIPQFREKPEEDEDQYS